MRGRISERWAIDLYYSILVVPGCIGVFAFTETGFFFFEQQVGSAVVFWGLIGLLLRLGWVPAMMLWGTSLGLFFDPSVKGGTPVTSILETVSYLSGGCVGGILCGFAIELLLDENRPRLQSPRSFDG